MARWITIKSVEPNGEYYKITIANPLTGLFGNPKDIVIEKCYRFKIPENIKENTDDVITKLASLLKGYNDADNTYIYIPIENVPTIKFGALRDALYSISSYDKFNIEVSDIDEDLLKSLEIKAPKSYLPEIQPCDPYEMCYGETKPKEGKVETPDVTKPSDTPKTVDTTKEEDTPDATKPPDTPKTLDTIKEDEPILKKIEEKPPENKGINMYLIIGISVGVSILFLFMLIFALV